MLFDGVTAFRLCGNHLNDRAAASHAHGRNEANMNPAFFFTPRYFSLKDVDRVDRALRIATIGFRNLEKFLQEFTKISKNRALEPLKILRFPAAHSMLCKQQHKTK